jgi:hypothetical protein
MLLMNKNADITMAVAAFGLYITGGVGTFGGLGLIGLMEGKDLFGLGNARTIGYLLLCTGLCLSILGVLLMRVFRNRGYQAIARHLEEQDKTP